MKLAHLADVHLDTAFMSFAPDVARRRRQGIQDAFRGAMETACDAGVDAILIAGDLYEQERVAPDTGAFLRDMFSRVAPIPVYVAPGNHDWLGPRSAYAQQEWTANVHIFAEDQLTAVQLSVDVTLWGAAHRAPANTDGFLESFRVDRGGVNLALFHGSERGRFVFQEEGKVPHAPFAAEQIALSGLDHVFTGHFHTAIDADNFTYPGNPEPLEFGEINEPVRGLVVATIESNGRLVRERIGVARTQVTDVDLDITGCTYGSEVRQRAESLLSEATGCVRVTVSGEHGADVDLTRADIERSAPGAMAIVVRVGSLTTAYDLDVIRAEATVRGTFVADVLASRLPDAMKERIVVTGLRALEGHTDLEVL